MIRPRRSPIFPALPASARAVARASTTRASRYGRVVTALFASGCVAAIVVLAVACRTSEPKTPVAKCRERCEATVSDQCTAAECERGCEFILDRLVEREGNNVLACVARTKRRCSDPVWASCAAHVGPHADGGPPAPTIDWNDD